MARVCHSPFSLIARGERKRPHFNKHPHGKFRFRHPWDQYLKMGAQSRQCAYLMEAIRVYNVEHLPKHLQELCAELSSKCSKALAEVASTMSKMEGKCAAAKCYVDTASTAAMQLRVSLSENCFGQKEVLRAAPIVSLSMEMVQCVVDIVGSVEELARLASFGRCEEVIVKGGGRTVEDAEAADISIVIEE